MEKIECKPRRWGNSLGIAIPKKIVEKEGISPGRPITITLNPKPDLNGLFGSLKFSKTAQQMKDEEREGWLD
jgi:hypothetical protein